MKKLKGLIILIIISLSTFGLSACHGGENKKNSNNAAQNSSYEQITAEEAKKIMDNSSGYIILDVRTAEEFAEGYIENAINISHEELKDKAEDVLADKEQTILVYCRSGRRSKIASETLVSLGYTNVKEFGGIIDWPYELAGVKTD